MLTEQARLSGRHAAWLSLILNLGVGVLIFLPFIIWRDGILILMAPKERRIRVATGYGMEKLLPDEKAKAAIDLMTPFFKNDDYGDGLSAGVEAIAAQTGDR